jgi:hypothetical protein
MNPRKISRRTFLAGALSTVALATLEACQQTVATSVPATGVTPSVSPGATVKRTATTVPTSPTLAPTAVSSPTPKVTKTPWPTATPAHYTQPSKLGLVVQRFSSPQIMDVIEAGQPKVVKIIDDLGSAGVVKERSPKTIVVGRISVDYDFRTLRDKNGRDPARHAADFIARNVDKYKVNTGVDYWEAYNEPPVESAEFMADYAAFEAERVKQMAALGFKCCIGNFSTGTPPLEYWPNFSPALQAAKEYGGWLGLHEYSAPVMQFGFGRYQLDPNGDSGDEGWYTLRYRRVYRRQLPADLRIPLIITECGVDGLVQPRPGPDGNGWRDFVKYWKQSNIAPDGVTGYLDQLIWYDEELQKDDYVIGATIYVAGAVESVGGTYEVTGDMADKLAWYWSAHPHS